MKNRSGYSLIEMIVVMTGGTVLMGIAVTLLCALLRAEGTGRALVERSASLSRLADQFRRDVHATDQAAKGIWRLPGKEGITLRLPARNAGGKSGVPAPQAERAENTPESAEPIRSVEYLADGGTVTRFEWIGDKLAGEESYNLGEGYSANIETVAADGRELVCLAIAPTDASSAGSRQVRIEAVLGWDQRFVERRREGK